jgi:hypothetical protein
MCRCLEQSRPEIVNSCVASINIGFRAVHRPFRRRRFRPGVLRRVWRTVSDACLQACFTDLLVPVSTGPPQAIRFSSARCGNKVAAGWQAPSSRSVSAFLSNSAKAIYGRRQIRGIPANRQKPRPCHRRYHRSRSAPDKTDDAGSSGGPVPPPSTSRISLSCGSP